MSAIYPLAAEGFGIGEIDWDTGVIKVSAVRGYTYSTAHKFVSDVTGAGGTLNGTSAALGSKTATAGVFDAADTTIPTTASASDHGLLVFQSSAVTGGADVAASSQRVIAWFDAGSDFPLQPGTGDTPVVWDSGVSKIFKIG